MADTTWGAVFIQTSAPSGTNVKIGCLWVDITTPTAPVVKVCTSVTPITFGYTLTGS